MIILLFACLFTYLFISVVYHTSNDILGFIPKNMYTFPKFYLLQELLRETTQLSSILSDKTRLKKPVATECIWSVWICSHGIADTAREGFHCSGRGAEAQSAHVAEMCSGVLQ